MKTHNDVSHDMKNCDFVFFYTKRYDLRYLKQLQWVTKSYEI